MGLSYTTKEINVFICGKEELSLTTPGELLYIYKPNEYAIVNMMTFFSSLFKFTPYNLPSDPTALSKCNEPTIKIYSDAALTIEMTGPPALI